MSSMSVHETMHALGVLRNMQPGWDSYDAPRISLTAVDSATSDVIRWHAEGTPVIRIAPLRDGGVAVWTLVSGGRAVTEYAP
jgi:hypothetical protein